MVLPTRQGDWQDWGDDDPCREQNPVPVMDASCCYYGWHPCPGPVLSGEQR